MKLRNLEEKDIEFIYEWMKDPTVNLYFRFDPDQVTLQSVAEFVKNSRDQTGTINLAIADDDDEYLGTVSLKNIDRINGHAEYAISLRSKASGKGVGTFATKAILDKAFYEIGLNRVYLNVLSDNIRAVRLYEKIGFKREGEFRRHLFLRGGYRDLSWYAILKEEYGA